MPFFKYTFYLLLLIPLNRTFYYSKYVKVLNIGPHVQDLLAIRILLWAVQAGFFFLTPSSYAMESTDVSMPYSVFTSLTSFVKVNVCNSILPSFTDVR